MSKAKIIKAYQSLDRQKFMSDYKERADEDSAFPIGYGQTISQPSLVLKMTLELEPNNKCKVLEIGTGSGFQTALLAKVSKEVFTVERIKILHTNAMQSLTEQGYQNIHYKLDDGNLGWSEHGPFDRIMVTAAAYTVPKSLIDQLSVKGKMVIPVKVNDAQDLLLIEKRLNGKLDTRLIDKVKFVDLVGNY